MFVFSRKCFLRSPFHPAKIAKNYKHHHISLVKTRRNMYLGTSESQFGNLTQVRVKNPHLGSNIQIDFSKSPDTYVDAYWREKYDGGFSFSLSMLDKTLIAINIFLKTVIFHLKPAGPLLVTIFTWNRSTPLLELSTDFAVLFSDVS